MARTRCFPGDRPIVVICFVVYLLSVFNLVMRLDTAQGISGYINKQVRLKNGSTLVVVRKAQLQASGYTVLLQQPTSRLPYPYNESKFQISDALLKSIDFPLRRYIRLDSNNIKEFVFVTAASNSFVAGVVDTIASVHKYYPGRRIIFYDLGISAHNKGKIVNLCDVEYRTFNFDKYPSHVSRLKSYTWKPLIIYEVLREYPGVFWMDSSARLLSGDFNITYPMLFGTDGILLFNFAGHNTFVVTHKTMYEYLPTNLTEMQRIYQYEANIMVMYGTKTVFDDVIKWWVLCALVERCMAPVYAVACRKTPPDVYAGCHRYDQTAINILLANKYNYNYTIYAKHYDNFEVIRRHSSGRGTPRICPTTAEPKAG